MSFPHTPDFLRIENLRFGYGSGAHQRLILDGIDMQFKPGQVVALMGGSGSGKTTILRLIGGQVRPSQGQVVFNGKVVHSLDRAALYALRRQMGAAGGRVVRLQPIRESIGLQAASLPQACDRVVGD